MYPRIYFLGYELSWYWIILCIAIIITIYFFYRHEAKINPSGGQLWQKLIIIYLLVLIGFVGGRFFSIIEYYIGINEAPSLSSFYSKMKYWESSRWYGALFTGWMFLETLFLYKRFAFNLKNLLVNICITSSVGLSIAKWGCFLDGHKGCQGIATSLPWGCTYPYGTAASNFPLHPVQVYDSIAYLILAVILYRLLKKGQTNLILYVYLGYLSVYNLLIEIIIGNEVYIARGISFAQMTYLTILVIVVIRFILFKTLKRVPGSANL